MGSRLGPARSAPERRSDLAYLIVERLGGRYSSELGVDVDAGEAEVERWFVAATLFGSRISASVAGRTFRTLDGAGLVGIAAARRFSWDELVALLDRGGYTRYDFRTATRLHALADALAERYDNRVATIGQAFRRYPQLRAALDALPGWGSVTVQVFLRELRGVWPGAEPPLDRRTVQALTHLRLLGPGAAEPVWSRLAAVAHSAGLDPRDLESGLVRLALAHHGRWGACPGGADCVALGRSAG